MSTMTLKPWTDVVKLHSDVESGALTERALRDQRRDIE